MFVDTKKNDIKDTNVYILRVFVELKKMVFFQLKFRSEPLNVYFLIQPTNKGQNRGEYIN